MAWPWASRAPSSTDSRATSRARLALAWRRLRRCRVSFRGVMRWNSTSDLLEISSRWSRRSALTRSTRSRASPALSPTAGGSSSRGVGSALGGSSTGTGSTGSSSSWAGGGATSPGRPCRRSISASMASRPAPSAQSASLPIRSSKSDPCSRASMLSGCRRACPWRAASSRSSITWATRTPASSPTMRAAPFREWAARMQASSWSAWAGLRSSTSRPVLSTWVWASASRRNSSSREASRIWSGVMPGSLPWPAAAGLHPAG
ncbi:hypothetical protein D3C85_757290 [compost metagenome]